MYFDIIKYMFTLVPMTLAAYFVSNDIQTNLIATKYSVVIRYQSIRSWMGDGCKTAVAITTIFFLIFHGSFIAASCIVCGKYAGTVPSVFADGQIGSVWVLLVKQILLVSALSMIQIFVAMRRNLQTGVLTELCLGGVVIFWELLNFTEDKIFCADFGINSLIYDIFIFAVILVCVLLVASHKQREKYLG